MYGLTIFKNGFSGNQSVMLSIYEGVGIQGAVLHSGVYLLPDDNREYTLVLKKDTPNLIAGNPYTFRINDKTGTYTTLCLSGSAAPNGTSCSIDIAQYGNYFTASYFIIYVQSAGESLKDV